MRKPLKWMHGPLTFHRVGRLMYSNLAMRVDFSYGSGIARHLFWQLWWVTGDKP